jgi:hypothetical protein
MAQKMVTAMSGVVPGVIVSSLPTAGKTRQRLTARGRARETIQNV